jgi:hypothetical protein
MKLPVDIETIPVQSAGEREEINERYLAHHKPRAEALRGEIAALKPPANLKDPAKIADWEANTKPIKAAALEQEALGEIAMAEVKAIEDWKRTSFDGALGQIVVIGYALGDGTPAAIYHDSKNEPVTSLGAEARTIRAFFDILGTKIPEKERAGILVVGHNVADFDLRFIWQRAVIHGIRPPHWMPWQAKPWGDHVFDTMVAWAGTKNRVSLDKLCRVLGIASKGSEIGDEIDGSKVWEFVQAGRIAEVATYCCGDVARAREIHQRMTFGE